MDLPLFVTYDWTLSRKGGADADGNPFKAAAVPVASGTGAFGYSSPRQQAYAARQGYEVDGNLTTDEPAATFRTGDLLTVNGETFRVVMARDLPLGTRVTLVSATNKGS